MPDDLSDALYDFARLSPGDRRGVELYLSVEQRQALRALLLRPRHADAPVQSPAHPPPRPALFGYSSWLAKRLTIVLAGGAATDATRLALQALLLERNQ